MGMFFPSDPNYFPDRRPVGFLRYTQTLERSWKRFVCGNFLTLLFFIPLAVGIVYAVLSSSVLVLIPVSILGGAIAGLGIAGMYDMILRALRDNRDDWWYSYKRAMKQNFQSALLPGAILGMFLGFFTFACYMLWISGREISLGTVAIMAAAVMLVLMVYSIWWPQIVLFSQKPGIQLKNCILFTIQNFWRVVGVSVLQLVWWVIFVLFMPWTAFLLPFLGVWYLWFLCTHLLYTQLDTAFRIEEQLQEAFPEQFRPEETL